MKALGIVDLSGTIKHGVYNDKSHVEFPIRNSPRQWEDVRKIIDTVSITITTLFKEFPWEKRTKPVQKRSIYGISQIVENKSSFLTYIVGLATESSISYIPCKMKKSLLLADMKTTWISPKPQTSSSPAGAMVTTYTPPQQGTPLYFHDKHFGLHGEILMFVVVGIFFIFLISLVLVPCLKRAGRTPESEDD